MRLKNVESGHGKPQKRMLEQMQAMRGEQLPLPDVLRLLLYRPELFGTTFSQGLEDALHGPSEWSVGERELFAAFVSNKNRCAY